MGTVNLKFIFCVLGILVIEQKFVSAKPNFVIMLMDDVRLYYTCRTSLTAHFCSMVSAYIVFY